MVDQGLPVSREPLDVCQRKVVLRIVREELEGTGEPETCALGISQSFQMQAPPLMGDGGP